MLLAELKNKEEEVKGDGKGVFLEDMTDEEYEDWVMKEEKGWKGFINKVFNLKSNEANDE